MRSFITIRMKYIAGKNKISNINFSHPKLNKLTIHRTYLQKNQLLKSLNIYSRKLISNHSQYPTHLAKINSRRLNKLTNSKIGSRVYCSCLKNKEKDRERRRK